MPASRYIRILRPGVSCGKVVEMSREEALHQISDGRAMEIDFNAPDALRDWSVREVAAHLAGRSPEPQLQMNPATTSSAPNPAIFTDSPLGTSRAKNKKRQ